jgi:hypothetical protein
MATSKTIAALLGPTLVASAVSLLANLATSQALIDELSQSPALIMIAGYARIRAGSCHCLLPQQMDARLASAGHRDGMAIACRRPPAHGIPHTARRNDDEGRSLRRPTLSHTLQQHMLRLILIESDKVNVHRGFEQTLGFALCNTDRYKLALQSLGITGECRCPFGRAVSRP